jgi:PKD repeat protein
MKIRLLVMAALCAGFALALGAQGARAVTSQPPIAVLPAAGPTAPPADAIVDSRHTNMSCGSWYRQSAYGDTWETGSTWWEYRCAEPGMHYPEDPGPTDYYYWSGSQSVLYGQWDWQNVSWWTWCSFWWDAATDRWYDPWGCWDEPPSASFVYTCSGLSCDFDGGASGDPDGTIVAYDWSFDDGMLGTGVSLPHTFPSAGTYDVYLTVTDDVGWQGVTWMPVTVTLPNGRPNGAFTFSCSGLSCTVEGGTSTDNDGTIVSYAWDFGDATTGSGTSAHHAYAQPGSYTVTLTVTDDVGATDTVSHIVVVTANAPPTAAFSSVCNGLTCTFSGGGSSDVDGSIVAHQWSFGDAAAGSGTAVVHTFMHPGSYTVTLAVTDDDGSVGSESKVVSLITLTAGSTKVKGMPRVDLSWTGSNAAGFDLYRSGTKIATVQASAYADNINRKGTGGYVYKVCTVQASICSNEATVTF